MSKLYGYNRLKFGKFLTELGDETSDIAENLHLQFAQQKGTDASVVDGFIAQESVKIVVETKLEDSNFSLDQLRRHLSAFGEEKYRMLVLLSPGPTQPPRKVLEGIREKVPTLHTTFDRILVAAEKCLSAHDEEMLAILTDFGAFCSSENLLPRDKFMMFTPPCGWSFDDNVKYNLYYCPRSYNRRASRFLGVYAHKSVHRIGRITKIVACNIDIEQGTVVPDEGEIVEKERQRILGAAQAARQRGWDISNGHKFYLCDKMAETDFRKTSSGGMPGHRYFDLGEVLNREELPDIVEIGKLLKCRTWE